MILLLASNCNKEIYGDSNQANHFNIYLPDEIDFDDKKKYGVALREFIYPAQIYTLTGHEYIEIKWIESIHKGESKILDIKKKSYLEDLKEFTYEDGYYTFNYKIVNEKGNRKSYIIMHTDSFEINKLIYYSRRNPYVFDPYEPEPDPPIGVINGEIVGDDIVFTFRVKNDRLKFDKSFSFEYTVYVKYFNERIMMEPKHFINVGDLLAYINSKTSKLKIKFENQNGNVVLSEQPSNIEIMLYNDLNYILGFKKTLVSKNEKAEYTPVLQRGIFSFFIYMSIVEHSVVGDVNAQLLRVVYMDGIQEGNTVHKIIDNPIFIPLCRNKFREIEVQINDDTGNLIPFIGGKCQLLIEISEL